MKVVEDILQDIGLAERPRIRVYNKLDHLETEFSEELTDAYVSAHTKVGLGQLRRLIAKKLLPRPVVVPTST